MIKEQKIEILEEEMKFTSEEIEEEMKEIENNLAEARGIKKPHILLEEGVMEKQECKGGMLVVREGDQSRVWKVLKCDGKRVRVDGEEGWIEVSDLRAVRGDYFSEDERRILKMLEIGDIESI